MQSVRDSSSNAVRGATGTPDREALKDRVRSLRIPKSPAPRLSPWLVLSWLVVLAAVVGAAIYGYRLWLQTAGDVAAPANADATSLPVQPTPRAEASADGLVLESKGYIIPAQQVLVSPKVGGMLLKLHIVEGMRVKKGDVLAELEAVDYQADYARAVAALDAARLRYQELQHFRPEEIAQSRAELSEAEAQLKQYAADWDRATQLFEAKALSTEERDAAQSRLNAGQQRVRRLSLALELMEMGPRVERQKAAEAAVREAEAELEKAKWRLDNCTVRAPISGTILRKNAEEGNIVNPMVFNGSYSLCEMADLSDMEVDLSIQERDISKVFAGQKCKIRAEAFPDRVYEGTVSRLMPIADRAKGAIPVRVKIQIPHEEEGVYLKPEMGAVVSFFGTPDSPSPTVPDPATATTPPAFPPSPPAGEVAPSK